MIKRHYKKVNGYIELYRNQLLLVAVLLVLILPSFTGHGLVSYLLFLGSMSFLFVQSTIVSSTANSKRKALRYIGLATLLILTWLEPAGVESIIIDVIQLLLVVVFFCVIIVHLVKSISKSEVVNLNVILSSIIIYLLLGIVGGGLAFLCFKVYPDAYKLPDNIGVPRFLDFTYFNFVTMSTVGYGDITPNRSETQTLSYLMAIAGQLYVAIVIAMLVGKYLMHASK